jgi:hypothetical protein
VLVKVTTYPCPLKALLQGLYGRSVRRWVVHTLRMRSECCIRAGRSRIAHNLFAVLPAAASSCGVVIVGMLGTPYVGEFFTDQRTDQVTSQAPHMKKIPSITSALPLWKVERGLAPCAVKFVRHIARPASCPASPKRPPHQLIYQPGRLSEQVTSSTIRAAWRLSLYLNQVPPTRPWALREPRRQNRAYSVEMP